MYVTVQCSNLCVLYATIQYNNLCTQTSVRDCVAQQPAYRSKNFQKKKNYKGLQNTTTSPNQYKKPHTKSKQILGKDDTGLTHSRLGSPAESPILLSRIKNPCNLGFGVTNLLLTLQTVNFNREHKRNRKKFLTYLITRG